MKKNNTGTGEVPAAEKRKPSTPKAESEALRKESRKNKSAEKKPVRQGETPAAPVFCFPPAFLRKKREVVAIKKRIVYILRYIL